MDTRRPLQLGTLAPSRSRPRLGRPTTAESNLAVTPPTSPDPCASPSFTDTRPLCEEARDSTVAVMTSTSASSNDVAAYHRRLVETMSALAVRSPPSPPPRAEKRRTPRPQTQTPGWVTTPKMDQVRAYLERKREAERAMSLSPRLASASASTASKKVFFESTPPVVSPSSRSDRSMSSVRRPLNSPSSSLAVASASRSTSSSFMEEKKRQFLAQRLAQRREAEGESKVVLDFMDPDLHLSRVSKTSRSAIQCPSRAPRITPEPGCRRIEGQMDFDHVVSMMGWSELSGIES